MVGEAAKNTTTKGDATTVAPAAPAVAPETKVAAPVADAAKGEAPATAADASTKPKRVRTRKPKVVDGDAQQANKDETPKPQEVTGTEVAPRTRGPRGKRAGRNKNVIADDTTAATPAENAAPSTEDASRKPKRTRRQPKTTTLVNDAEHPIVDQLTKHLKTPASQPVAKVRGDAANAGSTALPMGLDSTSLLSAHYDALIARVDIALSTAGTKPTPRSAKVSSVEDLQAARALLELEKSQALSRWNSRIAPKLSAMVSVARKQ